MDAQFNSPIGHDYILVIEWLTDEKDQKTGSDLVRWIGSETGRSAVHASCASASDVLAALEAAIYNLPSLGIPVVHFEAHGVGGTMEDPGGMSDRDVGGEYLPWTTLWTALRRLNEAAGFRLIVVAGACDGDNVRYGIVDCLVPIVAGDVSLVRRAPFVASLGFDGTVNEEPLRAAFRAFYKTLFADAAIDRALAAANVALVGNGTLTWTWTGSVVESVVRQVMSDQHSTFANELLGREATPAEVERVDRDVRQLELANHRRMFARMFGLDTNPEVAVRLPWAAI